MREKFFVCVNGSRCVCVCVEPKRQKSIQKCHIFLPLSLPCFCYFLFLYISFLRVHIFLSHFTRDWISYVEFSLNISANSIMSNKNNPLCMNVEGEECRKKMEKKYIFMSLFNEVELRCLIKIRAMLNAFAANYKIYMAKYYFLMKKMNENANRL